MVPVQFQMIMGQPDFADYDLSSLELMVSMGAALPKETKAHNITRHDAVKEAAVIAVPHEKWSETPLALVIPQEGAAASGDEIKEWVNSQVALKRPWNSRQPFRTSPAPCEITAEFSLPV
jgi:acyl-coenzyme A synthetase/AMP-(fatty) acid ligase